ncbi:MAG: hypothetical protein D6784_12260 [Chloroflexi bacterium]|nr:MAG: hypothetical protein D6784_12260 [Chloroflexota bacterium]
MTYVEYELEDGSIILIAGPEVEGTGGSYRGVGEAVVRAGRTFEAALEAVRGQALALRRKLEDLRADEVEVKFSLTTTGEAGNFAIGKIGVEANYEVTLKWQNRPQ